MILGMSIEPFTQLHTGISLIAIVTGLIALVGMLRGSAPGWITHVCLGTPARTTITGFLGLHAGAGHRHRVDGAADPGVRRPLRIRSCGRLEVGLRDDRERRAPGHTLLAL